MRLLTVHPSFELDSGAGNAARAVQLNRALLDQGVQCAILTTHRQPSEPPRALRDVVEVVSVGALGGRFAIPWRNLGALRRAVRSADVVLLMNHWTVLNAMVYLVLRRERVPYVVCPGGALVRFGRSPRKKLIYNTLIGRRLVRNAGGWIAVVREEVADFVPYGVPADAVTVIPNGLSEVRSRGDGARFRVRHGLGDDPVFLFLGRLAAIKGPDLLLAAFASRREELAGWRVVFAGTDEGMLRSLLAFARELGVDQRVHFVGFLGEEARQDALAAADLLVLPSRREVMSNVVLEAAAMGRPVLVTDRCGLPEIVDAGGGWIVPASVEGIAAGLVEAAGERESLPSRGAAWRRFATERYAWTKLAELHRLLFEGVLAAASGKTMRTAWG